jgi:hypothetical protein
MIHINRFSFICYFIISFGCKNSNNCYIYIANEGSQNSISFIRIKLDEKEIIKDSFLTSSISNDFKSYNFKLEEGSHTIEVLSDSLLIKREFMIDKKVYIYVISKHVVKNNYAKFQSIYKDSTKIMLKKFGWDSLEVEKDIGISISNKNIGNI